MKDNAFLASEERRAGNIDAGAGRQDQPRPPVGMNQRIRAAAWGVPPWQVPRGPGDEP